MMAKRLLLHISRPPSCLHRYYICRTEALLGRRYGRKFASLASNDSEVSGSVSTSATKTPTITTLKISNNSNPNEVNKFSSFASHWWDSRSNPLVGMNPIRVKFIRDVVDTFQPYSSRSSPADTPQRQQQVLQQLPLHNKRILDIGCGGGLLTESLSRLGASLVVGVDASTHVVEVAKRHSFHENSRLVKSSSSLSSSRDIRYIGGITVEELASSWLTEYEKELQQASISSADNTIEASSSSSSSSSSSLQHELFDIITALEIIEHVPNPSSLLQAAKSLLKPNGMLIVSTINRTVKSYGLAILAAEYILGKVPVGTHTWDMFWSPTEVELMISCSSSSTKNGEMMKMKQIALSGMVLQPPFINMEWKLDVSDTDVNWIGAYQKQQI